MTGTSLIRCKDWRIGYTRFSWPTSYLCLRCNSNLTTRIAENRRVGQAIAESFAALVKQGSSFTFGDGQPGTPQPGIAWIAGSRGSVLVLSYGEDEVQILLEKVGGTGVPWRVKVEHGMI